MAFRWFKQRRIYLDYAAGSEPNPSSIHADGVALRRRLEDARTHIARTIAVQAEEVIFTSGGTESNNTAILGVVRKAKQKFPRPHVITSAIEHASILKACKQAEREGADVTYLPVNEDGRIEISNLASLLRNETVLVSLMHANNETGVVQPIRDAGLQIRNFKSALPAARRQYPYFHVDAVQTAAFLSIEPNGFFADLLSVSGHKMGAQRGTGFLFIKHGTELEPLMYGGAQERGMRAGTEDVEGQINFARVFQRAQSVRKETIAALKARESYFTATIERISKNTAVSINGTREHALPSIINISFLGIESDRMVLELDAKGIAVSAGSACHAGQNAFSPVIEVMKGEYVARSAIRFSFSPKTKNADLRKTIKALREIISRLAKKDI